jgi:hypothetical protein
MHVAILLAIFLHSASSARAQTADPGPFVNVGTLTLANGTPAEGAVAIHGNIAVVGGDEIAHVFERDQATKDWNEVAVLTPSDGGPGFGRSVSTTGRTVVVGATGAAYVFKRHRRAWREVARLTPYEHDPGALFGGSVAISGTTIVVGAPIMSVIGRGSAYVFDQLDGVKDTWRETATLNPPPSGGIAEIGGAFGSDVSIDKDTIVVGTVWRLSLPALAAPRAHVFARHQGGLHAWGLVATLTQPLAIGNIETLPASVGISGDTAVLGVGGVFKSVHIYARDQGGPNTWGAVTELVPATGKVKDFGRSVALDGDTVAVHSPLEGGEGSSTYYVFGRNQGRADGWGQVARLIQPNRAPPGQWSIAVNSDTLMFDAPLEVFVSDIDRDGVRDGADPCLRDPLNNLAGGCGRESAAYPNLNDLLTMGDVATDSRRRRFIITATFTNNSETAIGNPFFEVTELTGGNVLLNGDAGRGQIGATLSPDVGDGVLSPAESMTVTFRIALRTHDPFQFLVTFHGEPAP